MTAAGHRPGGNRAGGSSVGRQPTPPTLRQQPETLADNLRPLLDSSPSLLAATVRKRPASLSPALGPSSRIDRNGRAVLDDAGHAGVWPLRPARHGTSLVGLSYIESVLFLG